jgi:DnaJ-domain-containing protein 1
MDRFFDRLGDAIKNMLDDEDSKLFPGSRPRASSRDPDLDSAYAELDEFLKTGKNSEPKPKSTGGAQGGTGRRTTWADPEDNGRRGFGAGATGAGATGTAGSGKAGAGPGKNALPESLRKDFAELGVAFGASADDCKAAYKKLLKIHHPDRHAGHPGNMKKATEKSARINAAYQKIEHWRETGKTE